MPTATIAQFNDGACVVLVSYTETTGCITAVSASIARGNLALAMGRSAIQRTLSVARGGDVGLRLEGADAASR